MKSSTLKILAIGLAISSISARTAYAQAEGDFDRSATLRYAWTTPPADFDPPFGKNPFQLLAYALPIYDTLVKVDTKANILPSLATSWKFSDDGLTLTFQLREGVKFSDGSTVDAAAVVRSLNRTKDDPNSLLKGALASFASFEAVNPTTVVMKLKSRDATTLYSLSTSAGMIVSSKALDDGVKLGEKPVGSGPYVLVSAGPEGATYQRNENYFDKSLNHFSRVTLQVVPDLNARLNLLQSGQIDAGLFQSDQSTLARADQMVKTGKFTSYSADSVNSMPLYLNGKMPPFDNPKVRLALNLAIDRAAISGAISNSECKPASQPLPQGFVGHDPALAYKQDVAKAKALLEEAGVKPFSFDVLVVTPEPYASIGVLLKAQLEAIGATMNIIPTPAAAGRPMFRGGKHAGLISAFSVVSPDSTAVMDASFMTPDTPGGVSPELSKAIEDAKTKAIGSPEREAAYKAISKMAYDNPYHVLICFSQNVIIARKGYVGADKLPYIIAVPMADFRNLGMLKNAQ